MSNYNDVDPYGLNEQPNNYANCFKAGQVVDDDFSDFEEFKEEKPEPVTGARFYLAPTEEEHFFVLESLKRSYPRKVFSMVINTVFSVIMILLPIIFCIFFPEKTVLLICIEDLLAIPIFFFRIYNNPHSLGCSTVLEESIIAIPIILGFVNMFMPGFVVIASYLVYWSIDLFYCLKTYRNNCKGVKEAIENREYTVRNGSIYSIERRRRSRYRSVKQANISVGRSEFYSPILEVRVALNVWEGMEGIVVYPSIPGTKSQVVVFAGTRHLFICSR